MIQGGHSGDEERTREGFTGVERDCCETDMMPFEREQAKRVMRRRRRSRSHRESMRICSDRAEEKSWREEIE